MKKIIVVLLLGFHFNLFSQSANFVRHNGNDDALEIMNKAKLDSILLSSGAKVNLLVLYTNGCSGTPFTLRRVRRYQDAFGSKMNILLTSSEPYKEIKYLKKLLAKFEIKLPKTYIIDSDLYPDDPKDDREKSVLFRNDICHKCQSDIIGVPYHVLFDNQKNILFAGYTALVNFDSLVNYYIQK